jgi:hypothetical protein
MTGQFLMEIPLIVAWTCESNQGTNLRIKPPENEQHQFELVIR